MKRREVKNLEIKEMPIQEKYGAIYDMWILENATSYAFHKEQGTLNKYQDHQMEAWKGYMGPMFEMLKTIAPGENFKQVFNQMVYMQQMMMPLSEIDASLVSDREAVMRFKTCEMLKRSKEIIKKTGLNIDPKFLCEMCRYRHFHPLHPIKDLATLDLEENGCKWTFKLK